MKIILAAKETDLRLAVQLLLSEEPGVQVVGSASNTGGLLALIKSDCPDLVLLDCDLPGQEMREMLPQIKANEPPPVIVLLGREEILSDELLKASVDHYIQKGGPPEILVEAFRQVVRSQGGPEDQKQGREEKKQS